jgi:peptidylprolyl isomerase domain and WD repeat-containing protein 1
MCLNLKVRIFKFATGKLSRVIDESIQHYTELQQKKALPNMEFNRRVAMEKEVEKTDCLHLTRLTFDESGHFLLVPTMIGIKVINLVTNRLARLIGKPENMRFLQLSLIQVIPFSVY